MDYRRLGKSGLRVPALSFGTGTFGGGNDFFKAWGSTDATGAARLVDICLDHGVNLFDSADVYSNGLAEQILGAAIKGKRNRLLISTKATFPVGDGANDYGSSRQHLLDAVDKALQRLGTDYIDLWQIHRLDHETPVEETMEALHDVVKAGKARYIGASAMHAWQFSKMQYVATLNGWTRFVSMQDEYNLIMREEEREMFGLQRELIGSFQATERRRRA